MLKTLIQNTKPEILVSISDEYLDHIGDDPLKGGYTLATEHY